MLKPEYIKTLIAQGEHEQQDFKFAITDSNKIAKTMSAFSNTKGGRLLIGVNDNGVISGVHSDEEYHMIELAATYFCSPKVSFSYNNHISEGKTIIEVKIPEVHIRPVACKDKDGKFKIYIRIDDQNIIAHSVQILAWKKMNQPLGIRIRYTDKEDTIIRALKGFKMLTLSELKKTTSLPHFKLIQILSDMVTLKIIGISQTTEGSRFYLKV